MLRFIILSILLASGCPLPSSTQHSKVQPLKLQGPRIVNGEEAELGQFPWQVALFVNGEEGGTWFCGGSIISEEYILTAGHCVDGAKSGFIYSGTLHPREGYISYVDQFILHEDYDIEVLENDIGLVKLRKALTFNNSTAPITLSSEELASDVEITVSGWGLTSDGATAISSVLNYVKLVTIENPVCDDYYGIVNDGIVCATSETDEVKSTCSGDSGGPVVVNAESDPVHVAVVSFVSSAGCESGLPSGYTRTATHRDWIREKSGI